MYFIDIVFDPTSPQKCGEAEKSRTKRYLNWLYGSKDNIM